MFSRLIQLVETEFGNAGRAALPRVLDAVGALLHTALLGGAWSSNAVVAVLEKELGQLGTLAGGALPKIQTEVEFLVRQWLADMNPTPDLPAGLGSFAAREGQPAGADAQFNPFGSIEAEIKKEINKLGDSVKGDIASVGHSATAAVQSAEHSATGAVQSAEHSAVSVVRSAAEGAISDVKAEAAKVRGAALAALAKKGLSAALALIDAAAPDDLSVQIGPVVIDIDPAADVAALRVAAATPPTSRDELLAFVKTLAGNASAGVTVSAEVAALFVASDSLSIGVSAMWSASTFIDRYHDIMDGIGFGR